MRIQESMSVSAVLTDQRSNIRLAVQPDQSQVTVIINGAQYQGVLVNQSSEGFGLLVLRGLSVDEGDHLRVVSDEVVHECLVCSRRLEDNHQYLGLRRVADVAFVDKPKKKKGKGADREKLHVAAGRGGRRKPKRKVAKLADSISFSAIFPFL